MKPLRNVSMLFLNYSDERYKEVFEFNIVSRGYHTDVVDELENNIHNKCIALISTFEKQINYIALVRKNGKVASKKLRIKIEKIYEFFPFINMENIFHKEKEEDIRFLGEIVNSMLVVINYTVWNKINEEIKKNQNNFELMKKVFNAFYDVQKEDTEHTEEINGFEKDSITFAIKCAGFDQYNINLNQFDIRTDSTPEFLRNLKAITVREDIMILHDSNVFDEWKIIDRNLVCTTLSDGTHKLSIMYANRLPLEQTLGVDLIYIDEKNKSIILVQYKRLIGDSKKKYYPYNDENYEREINTMINIKSKIEAISKKEYKYNSEAFYFKLCRDIQPSNTRELVDGMYIPINYWLHLLEGDALKGERGGVFFSYENVPTYLNNSTFINLIKTGLVGSSSESYELLISMISEILKSGNSLLLAKNE